MYDQEYQIQVASYGRTPHEFAIFTLVLLQLAMNTSGIVSVVLYVLSLIAAVFWVIATFYVATQPLAARGFTLLEPFVVLGILLGSVGVIFTTCCNTEDAIKTACGLPIMGLIATFIMMRIIRFIF
jgi:hypothetical protein